MAKGVGDVIGSLLSNDTDVSDIVSNRIFPFLGIEKIPYPYIIYTVEGLDPTQTKCEASVLDVQDVNIEIYAETLSEVEDLKRKLRNLLDRFSGTVEGIDVQSISFRDSNGGYADEDRVYVEVQLYSLRLQTINATFSRVTDLLATGVSSSQINLSWSDVATGETGYEIWRGTDFISWTLINTTAADATSYSNTGLDEATAYIYRIRAINATQQGEWSNLSLGCTDSPIASVNDWFEIEVTITGSTLSIPLQSGNVVIDWGDGSPILYHVVGTDPVGNLTHAYVNGTYDLRIRGAFWIRVNISLEKLKFGNIKNFGSSYQTTLNSSYQNVSTILISATDAVVSGTDWRNTFRGTATVLAPKGNTAQMTICSGMFQDSNFDDPSVGDWNWSLCATATDFAKGTTMSTATLDAILIGITKWSSGQSNTSLKSNVPIHFGTTSYTLGGDAEDAFNYLVNTLSWVITIL